MPSTLKLFVNAWTRFKPFLNAQVFSIPIQFKTLKMEVHLKWCPSASRILVGAPSTLEF